MRAVASRSAVTRTAERFFKEQEGRFFAARQFSVTAATPLADTDGNAARLTRDGEIHRCRPLNQIGAHAAGWNDQSVGICYEGGLDESLQPADTRTYAQKCALMDLLRQLRRDYPKAKILGHYQLSPYIRKACPCFDAIGEYQNL